MPKVVQYAVADSAELGRWLDTLLDNSPILAACVEVDVASEACKQLLTSLAVRFRVASPQAGVISRAEHAFQRLMSLRKCAAESNMWDMSTTREVSQSPIAWLNAVARVNM
eukprot:550589-Amphidinium_carterae.1